jgi:hypothetical protein
MSERTVLISVAGSSHTFAGVGWETRRTLAGMADVTDFWPGPDAGVDARRVALAQQLPPGAPRLPRTERGTARCTPGCG